MRKVDIPTNAFICVHYNDVVSKDLKGNELLIYSLIFGFTQDGNGKAIDTAYICEFLQISDKSAREILNRLVDKGYVDREDVEYGYTTKAVYKVVTEETSYTLEESSTPPGRNFQTDNIYNNIKEKNNIINNIIPKENLKKFVKPTKEEVEEYAKSINFILNGDTFIDYYDSVGWTVGKKPMKDWKACVRTWKNNSKKTTPTNNLQKVEEEKKPKKQLTQYYFEEGNPDCL